MPGLSAEAAHQLRRAERTLAAREERRARLLAKAHDAARLLRHEFGATSVWLFGSLRRPWFQEGSDIDLAVEGVPPRAEGAASDRLVEALGEDIDLVFLEDAEDGLRRRILESGELIGDGAGPGGR